MASTNITLSDVYVFTTEALRNANITSVDNTSLALTKSDLTSIADKLLARNGYIKYSNGLIIQWGWYKESTSSSDYLYFPIAFPTECYMAVAGNLTFNTKNNTYEPWITIVDKTKFLCGIKNDLSGGSGEEALEEVSIIAIGH